VANPGALFSARSLRRQFVVSTLVTLGNAQQRFDRLLAAVAANVAQLPRPLIVQHGRTPWPLDAGEACQFLAMERFAECVADADVVIAHAGAGSILHALQAGKRPLLMPRLARCGEHRDDHQQELASWLERDGRAICFHDAATLGAALQQLAHLPAPQAASSRESLIDAVAADLRLHAARLQRSV
jgi:UDP-N-acetylglucosamine transferase subunit ALG13